MVSLRVPFALLLSTVLSGSLPAAGAPLTKRIAQTISDSTQQWVKACEAAGGGEQCNPVSVTAFSTLLAAAGPCEQQNSADAMIDLAKQLKNDADMIKFAQIFAQQPRNTPTSQAVPYCQQAPKNSELNGLFQCQFQGADQTTFVGGVKVGGTGTIPFGHSSPVSPPGSCPAQPSGPIPDGQQLVSITQDPGLGNISGGSGNGNNSAPATATNAPAASSTVATQTATATDNTVAPAQTSSADPDDDDCSATVTVTVTTSLDTSVTTTDAPSSSAIASATATDAPTTPSASVTFSPSAPVASSAASSSDFHLKNGEDAQALNAKFASLTANSICTEGDQACISGGFAQCVSGKFAVSGCAGGTQCFALPLVNKPGTSLACTTQNDASSRIAATGAQGGIDGSGN